MLSGAREDGAHHRRHHRPGWAKTGMNSVDVARQVHNIFNEIMEITYEELDAKVSHEWAQKMRYTTGDIEQELEDLLHRK